MLFLVICEDDIDGKETKTDFAAMIKSKVGDLFFFLKVAVIS